MFINGYKITATGTTLQNIVDDMTTYTDAIEQGEDIGNDEQMFIDSQIVNRRFPWND